jgi:hypothetical protein
MEIDVIEKGNHKGQLLTQEEVETGGARDKRSLTDWDHKGIRDLPKVEVLRIDPLFINR